MSLIARERPLTVQSLERQDSKAAGLGELEEPDHPGSTVHPAVKKPLRRGWSILIGLSAIAHVGLLLLPMPQGWLTSQEPEDSPDVILEESGAIAITTLPIVAQPEVVAPAPPPPPAPPVLSEPPPLTEIPDDIVLADTLEEATEPLDDLDIDGPEEEEEPPAEENNDLPEAGIAVPFSDDFSHLAGAQAGCYGLNNCLRVEGQNFRDISKEISQRLENQGYVLTIHDNGDTSGGNHRIYEMRSQEQSEVKYLNIFGEGLTGGFYMITPDIITKEDLETLEING